MGTQESIILLKGRNQLWAENSKFIRKGRGKRVRKGEKKQKKEDMRRKKITKGKRIQLKNFRGGGKEKSD